MSGVVVGCDGGPEGEAALDWAVEEAAVRGVSLTVCVAWQYPPEGMVGITEDDAERAARDVLARALAKAGDTAVPRMERGLPSTSLLRAAVGADLLVLGPTRAANPASLGAGSVTAKVLSSATSSIVVARGASNGRGVVVGTDGSGGAEAAVALALVEAAHRGVPLTVVHRTEDDTEPQDAATKVRASLAARPDARPDVAVIVDADRGDPAEALLAASASAALVVVGARGLGPVRGAALGSVSQRLVRESRCPVAVAKPTKPI
ncbi:universal stress protein [Actinocorallia sp. API 0066]|uniref:universal stress protein n=1 Tax=Actinocorallia sp. API 0066 TaxID=2896846 RepID=UPI001E416FC6|nr:universal stress protein [Actinocorallia sp. API 0066]MCD0448879.1 universal stress protein [Actinocorallia sp. API 0066]